MLSVVGGLVLGLASIAWLVVEGVRCERADRRAEQLAVEELDAGPACRVCGCTEWDACDGGCWWVTDPIGLGPLCSTCLECLRFAETFSVTEGRFTVEVDE